MEKHMAPFLSAVKKLSPKYKLRKTHDKIEIESTSLLDYSISVRS